MLCRTNTDIEGMIKYSEDILSQAQCRDHLEKISTHALIYLRDYFE